MKNKKLLCLALACTFLTSVTTFAACGDELSSESETASSTSSSSSSVPPLDPILPEPPEADPPTEGAPETPETPPAPEPEPPATPQIQTAQYIKCTGSNVNIRAGAGTGYAVLGSAEKDTTYAVIGRSGNWYKTYYRGQTAYLNASYVSVFTLEKTTDTDVENVLSEGYKLIGVPYVYGAVRVHDGNGKLLGGFSAQKFDCSSLVQYIFYKGAGELLQVNTRTQIKQGKYVHPNDLQRGDCIYFTNEDRQYNTGIERVGHVAVYLGNNYILHTSSDYARIEKMSAKRWSFYIEARRFV